MKKIFLLLCILLLSACRGVPAGDRVLFDFESDGELDRFHWQCHTLMSLSDEHVSHGRKALKLELYPSAYPGLAPMIAGRNWRGFEALRLDIYNPEERPFEVTTRIDDREDYPDFGDRYNRSFGLVPGWNRVRIPLAELKTSGTGRSLNLANIYRVLLFMVNPSERHTLYVDHVRLTVEKPED